MDANIADSTETLIKYCKNDCKKPKYSFCNHFVFQRPFQSQFVMRGTLQNDKNLKVKGICSTVIGYPKDRARG